MSKRTLNFVLGTIALISGGILYILFRENSYIANIFRHIFGNISLSETVCQFKSLHFHYYLPDFLWAFSLGCMLNGILGTKQNIAILCALLAFICGVIWEFLQILKIIRGTFDFVDILMYFFAGILCYLINSKERK